MTETAERDGERWLTHRPLVHIRKDLTAPLLPISGLFSFLAGMGDLRVYVCVCLCVCQTVWGPTTGPQGNIGDQTAYQATCQYNDCHKSVSNHQTVTLPETEWIKVIVTGLIFQAQYKEITQKSSRVFNRELDPGFHKNNKARLKKVILITFFGTSSKTTPTALSKEQQHCRYHSFKMDLTRKKIYAFLNVEALEPLKLQWQHQTCVFPGLKAHRSRGRESRTTGFLLFSLFIHPSFAVYQKKRRKKKKRKNEPFKSNLRPRPF